MLPRRSGRKLYILCLALGTFLLVRSLVLQLFWPMAAADRSPPHIHRAFCTAQLSTLRRELEEATWKAAGTAARGADPARRRDAARIAWRRRLAEVAVRCAGQPHQRLADRLGALEREAYELWQGAQDLWLGEGQALGDDLVRASH